MRCPPIAKTKRKTVRFSVAGFPGHTRRSTVSNKGEDIVPAARSESRRQVVAEPTVPCQSPVCAALDQPLTERVNMVFDQVLCDMQGTDSSRKDQSHQHSLQEALEWATSQCYSTGASLLFLLYLIVLTAIVWHF